MRFHYPGIILFTVLLSCNSNPSGLDTASEIVMMNVDGGSFVISKRNPADSFTVILSDFQMSQKEITQREWLDVLIWSTDHGYSGISSGGKGRFGTSDHPVTEINWYDILKWCNALSEKSGLTPVYYNSTSFAPENVRRRGEGPLFNAWVRWDANGYRLPTEAEWEYAASGGRNSHYYIYSGSDSIDEVAWYLPSGSSETLPTHIGGLKKPNELQLFDMSGNVNEWCWDGYGVYPTNPVSNPRGPDVSDVRIIRGGSVAYNPGDHQVTSRRVTPPGTRNSVYGFRLCCSRQ